MVNYNQLAWPVVVEIAGKGQAGRTAQYQIEREELGQGRGWLRTGVGPTVRTVPARHLPVGQRMPLPP